MNAQSAHIVSTESAWWSVCALADLVPGCGVAARFGCTQVALFHTVEGVFAIGNHDPFSGANVLSRGIVGDLRGRLVVASPVYKQHFCLRTGECLEDPQVGVPAWTVRVVDEQVLIADIEPGTALNRRCSQSAPVIQATGRHVLMNSGLALAT